MKSKAVVYDTLTLYARKHPIQFTVGVGFYGDITDGRVKGIDLNMFRERLERENLKLRGKEIKTIFPNYRGMETVAEYYLKLFTEADFIKVIENGTEEVEVWRE